MLRQAQADFVSMSCCCACCTCVFQLQVELNEGAYQASCSAQAAMSAVSCATSALIDVSLLI